MNILTVNLLFSTFVFWVAALMFLAPGATYAGIAPQFARPAAFGDLLAALLALAAIPAVWRGLRGDGFSYGFSTSRERWT